MGECFGGLLLVALGVGFLVLVVQLAAAHAQKLRENALLATRRWKGWVEPGGWTSKDLVHFQVDGVPGTLTWYSGSKNSPPYTRAEFSVATGTRLRVRPQGFFFGLRSMFGAEDLQIGDPAFDPEFQIESVSVQEARRILTPQAKRSLIALRSQDVTYDVAVAKVTVQVRRCLPGDLGGLVSFVDLAVVLLGACRRPETGIQVEAVVEEMTADCPVCSTPMDDLSVACAKCATRHHPECWDYLGGCARYACGGKKARP